MGGHRAERVEAAPPAGTAAAVAGPLPRSRHGGPALTVRTGWLREPGVALVLGSLALAACLGVAVAVGWFAVLFVVALLQVFLAGAWVSYLEVPADSLVAAGVVVVAGIADAGVVVARLRVVAPDTADGLVQVAPALGAVFLVAVVAQLLRRDGRAGTLAGLVAACTGGVLVVGLALWLPIQASNAGNPAVVVGTVACAVVGAGVGLGAWIRRADVVGPALLLPVLLALAAGPVYLIARIHAG